MSMLKRTLVLLGDTPSSLAARAYAFRLVQQTGTDLAGLAGVDLGEIEGPMLGGIGMSAYQTQLQTELKRQADTTRDRLQAEFADDCRSRSLTCEAVSFEGDPADGFRLATETRDLAVAGHDTGFGGSQEPLSAMIAKLVVRTPRPLIVCPDELPAGDAVLIAYDGSLPAMRALQVFALLGLGDGKQICALAIDRDEAAAARKANAAAEFLKIHGHAAEAIPTSSSDDPADLIRAAVAERNIGTVVMGAYGNRGFREALFGSTTDALVDTPPCALFLYH
jgi:nucleotide-binding universal stress UspA family protein